MVIDSLRILAVLLAVTALPGSAAAATAGSVQGHRSEESAAAVRDYWTPERMAQAVDMSTILDADGTALESGLDFRIPAPEPETSGEGAVASALRHRFAWEAPPAIGRLFFRWGPFKGTCTATAIDTPGRRLLLTAGHCLKSYGLWSRAFAFVPGYFHGRRPFGTWTWKTAWVTGPWGRHSDEHMANFDLGVIVTRRSWSGRRVGDVAGALSYRSYPRRNGRTRIFGYPSGSNRAREVRVCAGRRTWSGPWYSYRLPGPPGMAARCNMAGGSSGGPWLSAYDDGEGGIEWIIDGLTSTGTDGRRASPYFGRHFRALIHNAEHR